MTDTANAHTAITSLRGRRAVITGGTTGIGRAIAVLLASEGCRVFICGRDEQHLADALARVREVGEGDGIAIDLSDEANVGKFLDAGAAAMGGYDIAIANAAEAASGLSEEGEADLRHAIAVDFTAYLLTARRAANDMAAKNMGDTGDIILIGSMSAYVLGPQSTVYAGIKHGLQGFSVALRRELGPKGIRVSLVEPGLTGSDMQFPETPPEKQREMIAAEKMLRAEDIAVGVQYLLTQPRRTVIQRLTISPRVQDEE